MQRVDPFRNKPRRILREFMDARPHSTMVLLCGDTLRLISGRDPHRERAIDLMLRRRAMPIMVAWMNGRSVAFEIPPPPGVRLLDEMLNPIAARLRDVLPYMPSDQRVDVPLRRQGF